MPKRGQKTAARARAMVEQMLAPGYGTCGRCRRSWKFVEGHDTPYAPGLACFPLCEDCWDVLGTPEKRMPYYRELYRIWEIGWKRDPLPASIDAQHRAANSWENIERAVLEGK